jgi:hypothetical protein
MIYVCRLHTHENRDLGCLTKNKGLCPKTRFTSRGHVGQILVEASWTVFFKESDHQGGRMRLSSCGA